MHVIIRRRLLEFGDKHPGAREPLDRWYRVFKHTDFDSFADLRRTFRSADVVGRLTVFNIGGNKYRLIALIIYEKKRIYIRHVLTHREYDQGTWKD